jgi:hypothetical protein
MCTFWMAAVLVAAPVLEDQLPSAADTSPALTQQEPLLPPRTGRELQDAARATLRRWARPSDKEADLAAREFIVLYEELCRDNQLARSQREQLRAKIRGRLLKLADQIRKRVAIEKRRAKAKRPPSVLAPEGQQDILAQWGGFGGMAGGMGPGIFGGGPGAAAPPNDDYGEELVELIQQTIAPTTWDVNGGLGSIYYWRPGRAIVVRQTGDVHDEIGGVLEQLRRLGP